MTSYCSSSPSSNIFLARCFFRWRNKWKSLGVRSGLHGGWSNISHLNFSRSAVVACAEWGRALSWSRRTPRDIPLLLFRMAGRSRVKVSQYAAALIVAPGGMTSTRKMPFLSQKTEAMIFSHSNWSFEFFYSWGSAYGAIAVTVAWIQECGENHMFHLQSQWSPETHLLPVRSAWETSARNPSVSFFDRPLIFWAPSVHTIFCTLTFLSQLHQMWS